MKWKNKKSLETERIMRGEGCHREFIYRLVVRQERLDRKGRGLILKSLKRLYLSKNAFVQVKPDVLLDSDSAMLCMMCGGKMSVGDQRAASMCGACYWKIHENDADDVVKNQGAPL